MFLNFLYSLMKVFRLFLLFLIMAGCSTGVIVHDSYRAAELIVDFLSAIRSPEGTRLSYAWTDSKYKEEVSFSEFSRIVASIREKNNGAAIQLDGYEVFGAVEIIIVHASSELSEGKMFFRFTLSGTKFEDYNLLKLGIADSEFAKEGIYGEYGESISVEGV